MKILRDDNCVSWLEYYVLLHVVALHQLLVIDGDLGLLAALGAQNVNAFGIGKL